MSLIWDILFSPFGRCYGHIPGCLDDDRCVYVFLGTDGVGFALLLDFAQAGQSASSRIDYERVDFRWDNLRVDTSDLMWSSIDHMEDVCEVLFMEHINPQLKSPYTEPDGQGLMWHTGSEEELSDLADAICVTEPGLLEEGETVEAVFKGRTRYKRCSFLYVERGEGRQPERYTSARLAALCDLAVRFNQFSGLRLSTHSYREELVERCVRRYRVPIWLGTRHENAEAFLYLMDWLDDKIHDPKKRALYGLPLRTREPLEPTGGVV